MNYRISYAIAAFLFLANVFIAAIQAVWASGHGADLGISPQVQAWLAIISTVIAAALGILPQIQRTPADREAKYLAAAGGVLPDDLAKQHPTLGIPASEATLSTPPDH